MTKIDKNDTALGLEIVRALSEKDGDLLVSSVGEYMRYHGLTASPDLLGSIPFKVSSTDSRIPPLNYRSTDSGNDGGSCY